MWKHGGLSYIVESQVKKYYSLETNAGASMWADLHSVSRKKLELGGHTVVVPI
jgi:hypothetical protein